MNEVQISFADLFPEETIYKKEVENHILIQRRWAMPSANTFNIQPIKELVENEVIRGGG